MLFFGIAESIHFNENLLPMNNTLMLIHIRAALLP